jgi:hypothetical protein
MVYWALTFLVVRGTRLLEDALEFRKQKTRRPGEGFGPAAEGGYGL